MPTLNELTAANIERQKEWDQKNQITLSYRGNEMAGEVGEACNVIKKLERERLGIVGSRASREQLASELSDVIICVSLIAGAEGLDLDAAIVETFNKKSEEFKFKTRLAPQQEGIPTAYELSEEDYRRARDCMIDLLRKDGWIIAKDRDEKQFDNAFQHAVGIMSLTVARPSAESITTKAPQLQAPALEEVVIRTSFNAIDLQNAEYDALNEVINSYKNGIQKVAVVDDDFPRVKHRYERCIAKLIEALKNNGRLPTLLQLETTKKMYAELKEQHDELREKYRKTKEVGGGWDGT